MNFNLLKKKEGGFTLIELLMVISIISLLSVIVLTSLSVARSKARDSYRMSSLKQLSNALELFYSTYNRYPIGTFNSNSFVYSCNGGSATDWITDNGATGVPAISNWDASYLSSQPHDPQENNCNGSIAPQTTLLGTPAGYSYYSTKDGSTFALIARLENDTGYDIQSTCQKWMISPFSYLYSGCGNSLVWNQTTYFVNNTYK